MAEEKLVYVYGWQGLFNSGLDGVDYCTDPPLDGHMVGGGSLEGIALIVEEIVSKGYLLIVDQRPDGERLPLTPEARKHFSCLGGK